jgi:23S rRNA (cytidine1920-2'-O)/16S rRNA (cytidine1409-2'-O)-methyltransferase
MIEGGGIRVGGIPVPKAATLVDASTPIELVAPPEPYVGRGGRKLEGAMERFPIDVAGRRALDAGASTGGFTDFLLQHGVGSVLALDVGYGQLDDRLLADVRVEVRDRTNLRHVGPDDLGGTFELIVADLSFISLCTVAPALARLASPDATSSSSSSPSSRSARERSARAVSCAIPRSAGARSKT